MAAEGPSAYAQDSGRLTANAFNGVAISSLVGGTIGQIVGPDTVRGDLQFVVFLLLALLFHVAAHSVLWLVYRR